MVTLDDYHQLYRYCIELSVREYAKEEKLEQTLNHVRNVLEAKNPRKLLDMENSLPFGE